MKIRLTVILLICSFMNLSVEKPATKGFQQYFFAVGIIANPTGSDPLLSFAVVSMFNGEMVAAQPITKNTFIRMACGDWPSKANPNKEDLFLKNGIEACGRYVDTMTRKKVYLCDPIDSLWKVRYKDHPYQFDDSGWSHGKYKPNARQIEYLYQEYEVAHINVDFFIGAFMWKLLRDVQDSTWVMNYKSLEDI